MEHERAPTEPRVARDTMAQYEQAARRRREQKVSRLAARRERALDLARRAAEVLRSEFGAQRVTLFGSAVRPESFHQHSDVDVAAWGISEQVYLRAVARLLSLEPDVSVDLIRAEEAAVSLLERVEREGIPL